MGKGHGIKLTVYIDIYSRLKNACMYQAKKYFLKTALFHETTSSTFHSVQENTHNFMMKGLWAQQQFQFNSPLHVDGWQT